jgi:hypothetical protein
MSQVGFQPTILVFERAEKVHALLSAASVIGSLRAWVTLFIFLFIPRRIRLLSVWNIFQDYVITSGDNLKKENSPCSTRSPVR